jgi:hypothetical protein
LPIWDNAGEADSIAHLCNVVHAGLPIPYGYRYSAIGEIKLGLDQDGLLGREMLWSPSCKLLDQCRQFGADDQVHRFCFALALFHLLLSALLIGVRTTKTKRAAIQNG